MTEFVIKLKTGRKSLLVYGLHHQDIKIVSSMLKISVWWKLPGIPANKVFWVTYSLLWFCSVQGTPRINIHHIGISLYTTLLDLTVSWLNVHGLSPAHEILVWAKATLLKQTLEKNYSDAVWRSNSLWVHTFLWVISHATTIHGYPRL